MIGFFELGALPQRPAKGLSDRPLETFGRKLLVTAWSVWTLGLTAPVLFYPMSITMTLSEMHTAATSSGSPAEGSTFGWLM